ncbi:TRAP transporter large permease subunit [Pelagibacterium halotolerans]|uniref:TRAP-type C4-dicarboxylate transport system, large permease component n=1 Tax=Pelagibacterium halotolerans (strain DSM 22347 / JCM 15775 / CGMCC 1.7692 / B2) TaxID=1082931 RepID=G4R7C5_PELHB|nr:TRAP transporter large permease subunit [Pelagibacterium halotolerans]AEQ51261.1 TRAP-type C4-dicarboxylate transport system, large permease component [Pelagibacterium halotolerans B2]QJR18881.1 TRAP transporter large permease subunit [Pelagibacterium halotolerans]SEA67020.1 TRAP transporter, DctM subunit [Pelagibacterium halotolerans]
MADQTARIEYPASGAIDRIDAANLVVSQRIAFAGVLGVLAIAALIVADVLLRVLFRAPVVGLNEYIEMFFAVAIAATFPSAVANRGHLKIDLLGALGPRTKLWLSAFGSFLLSMLFVIVAWQVGLQASEAVAQQYTTTIHNLPVGIFYWIIAALVAISAINQIVVFVVDVFRADWSAGERMSAATPLALCAAIIFSLALWLGFESAAATVTNWAWSNPGWFSAIVFGALWVMLLAFVPVAAVTGLLAVAASSVLIGNDPALSVIGSELTGFLTTSEVSVLPLFLIMGILAAAAGISDDVFRIAQALLGHMRGGLAMAAIGGCAGFGAVTGSSVATVATIGSASLPEMRKRGYSERLSTGSIAAGGTLGALIPPSGALVFYAFLTEQSIGQLFMAAMIPAALAVLLYLATIAIWVKISPASAPRKGAFSLREFLSSLRRGVSVIGLFVVVMGGIYSGIFTVNEAAAVGAILAFIIAWSRGSLRGAAFWTVMGRAASMTAMIYALVIGGLTLSFFVSTTGLPNMLTDFVASLNLAPLMTIALLMLVYIALGAIMESFAIMIITVPIVAGLITGLGYDLIWWGVVMLVVLEIGQISPPFGMNVFVLQSISGKHTRLGTIYKGVMPFLAADFVKLAILILFPVLSLWLPSTMF